MIKITTDSTCDLPRELLERYNITVTPLGIIKAGKLYQDGVDIRTGDIAAHVDAGGEITTTNAVNVADYEELFRRLMEEYDAVIHLNIGMGFSSCHQNARLAAEEVDGVYVVDSANPDGGPWDAGAGRRRGRGGREVCDGDPGDAGGDDSPGGDQLCAGPAGLHEKGRSLLHRHGPGCQPAEAPPLPGRSGRQAAGDEEVPGLHREGGGGVRPGPAAGPHGPGHPRAFLVDTCPDDHLASIAREVLRQDGRFQEIIEAKAGCTIFCHCGPGTLGVIFLRKA